MFKDRFILFISVFLFSLSFLETAYSQPNQIDYAVSLQANKRDSAACENMAVKNGLIVFPKEISNPAMACPDAWSWKVFLEAIQAKFWANWAYDGYSFPEKPLPLCTDGQTDKSSCCDPDSKTNPGYSDTNNPGKNCPYYPGDFTAGDKQPKNRVVGQRSFKQRTNNYHSKKYEKLNMSDPGRIIRQEDAEMVFRNKPMLDYIFNNNLYNQEGLGQVFSRANSMVNNDAPYTVSEKEGGVTEVQFPYGSVMFKADWLHEDRAKQLGLKQNKANPYITMEIETNVGDNDAPVFKKGMHYLVAMTVASKDVPNWVWFAMEHVDNLGRCDYTGCNDSFGHESADKVPAGYHKNFTQPHVASDGLKQAEPEFITGKKYKSGAQTEVLKAVFKQLGIGQEKSTNKKVPSVNDKGWLSYRLKGSQVNFTTVYGYPTILGNSVTEGGFVNSSSCISCHVQAAVKGDGTPYNNGAGFVRGLNLTGYNRSAHGAPNPDWFYNPGSTPTYEGVQIDFVWGILFANPIGGSK